MRKLEHEVRWKFFTIAAERLIQRARLDAIDLGKVGVENHALAAELRAIECRHRGKADPDTIPDLIDAIRARYDLREDLLAGAG